MDNIQSTLFHIWDVFVKSNAFNFTVFLATFVFLAKKFDLKSGLESLQKRVADIIESAKAANVEAKIELEDAKKSVKDLESELKTIITEAEKSAGVISEKIITDAKKQVEIISSNIERVIDAEEKMLVSKLTKNTSKASVKVARAHIENTLKSNPSLHEKYINESIDSLDRLNF